MIFYTEGTSADTEAIANLHALSWEQHYQGEFTANYLEHEVRADRMEVWTKRMKAPNPKQYVIMAKEGDVLCGFACVYLEWDLDHGALLDNLHVWDKYKGRGIGRQLMQKAAQWVAEKAPDSQMYLWVLETNIAARRFYEKVGGTCTEKTIMDNPGGGSSSVLRYVWSDL